MRGYACQDTVALLVLGLLLKKPVGGGSCRELEG